MKILVIQTAFIGDLVMSTTIFPALQDIYPNAEIHALTIPASAIILKYNPIVKKVYKFDKRNGFAGKILSFFSIARQLRSEKFDLAVSIQHSITSSMLMLFAGIKIRVGNQRQKFLTHQATIPKGLHNRQRVLSLLSVLSEQKFPDETKIYLSDLELSKADEIIASQSTIGNKKIVIAPGSVWATKRWLPEYFAELIRILSQNNIDIFIIDGPDEGRQCQDIIKLSGQKSIPNLAGKLNLLESAALISKMDLLICNDSSPLHLANAVGTNVFAFFGPTVKSFGCYPYRAGDKMLELDLPCRPCAKHGSDTCPLGHHDCMRKQLPADVAEMVLAKLGD